MSYGPDTDFQYMRTVTLTLEIRPWVKVMTHPWVMDSNCVKYQDRTSGYRVLARTGNRQTVIPIYPPNFVCGGMGGGGTNVVFQTIIVVQSLYEKQHSYPVASINKPRLRLQGKSVFHRMHVVPAKAKYDKTRRQSDPFVAFCWPHKNYGPSFCQ